MWELHTYGAHTLDRTRRLIELACSIPLAPRLEAIQIGGPVPQRRKDSPSLATDIGRDARVREVTKDVAFRLAGVCAGLPPGEFAALVKQIAAVTVKYEALAELHAARVATPP